MSVNSCRLQPQLLRAGSVDGALAVLQLQAAAVVADVAGRTATCRSRSGSHSVRVLAKRRLLVPAAVVAEQVARLALKATV